MRWLVVSLLAGVCVRAEAQEVKPYLRIETGAHTTKVDRIDVDAAQRFLVSASLDKTARVWDLHDGSLLKILRPPIGDFQKGYLYAVAISPDGRTVAVGGFTTAASAKDEGPVYIFDRESGVIRATIPGLPRVTDHLAYSQDGRFLAAALGGNNGIRIYETVSYSEVAHDSDYGDNSYGLEFDKSGKLVTTSYDGFVRLYSSEFHLLRKERPPSGKQPFSVHFSPDGELVLVGFGDIAMLDVLSASDLSFRYRVQPPTAEGNLSVALWSANGRTLCAAGMYRKAESVYPVLCWGGAGKGKLTSFPVVGTTVMDIRALRDGRIAYAAGDGTVGVLGSNGETQWRAASEILDHRGPSFPKLSSDGDNIEGRANSFNGTEWTFHTFRFSVTERKLKIDPKPDASLSSPVTGALAILGWKDGLTPTLDGHALKLKDYERSRSLAIDPKQESFVLGTEWNIHKFDKQGKPLWRTPTDIAWGVNVTPDQRFVVATLGDGTVRWYTFDKGKEVLALFVDRDLKRWVAWNPDGFFAFEAGGDALIGYQINRGPGQASDFVKVDQLRDVFYRPDLIAQILKPGGAEAVLAARNGIGDVSKVLSGGLPPEIELVSVAQTDEPNKYLVQFRVNDMGGGRGRIVYRIDGIEIEARDAVDIKGTGSDTISRYITVGSGQHTMAITGRSANDKIEGTPKTARLTGRQPMPGSKTALYVIAAGISHYSDHSLDAGVKFAAADADLVAARFQEQEGKGLYKKVKAVALPDSKATANNIRDAVVQAAAAIQPGDTFVLYLAGHGEAIDGEYYFIPWEAEYTNQHDLLAKSLNREAIQGLLKQIHTNKSVLILDTCGAGAYLEGRATTVTEKAAIEKVATMSGRAVIAASNSEQMAMDGYQNHGVFTYALLQGLQAAESNAQGEILITRLAEYVQSRVPEITVKTWHYKQMPMSRIEGEPFPIAHRAAN